MCPATCLNQSHGDRRRHLRNHISAGRTAKQDVAGIEVEVICDVHAKYRKEEWGSSEMYETRRALERLDAFQGSPFSPTHTSFDKQLLHLDSSFTHSPFPPFFPFIILYSFFLSVFFFFFIFVFLLKSHVFPRLSFLILLSFSFISYLFVFFFLQGLPLLMP